MDPKIRQLLQELLPRFQTSNPQVAQGIQQYLATNGDQPLDPSVLMVVEPFARQRGMSLLSVPNQGIAAAGRLGPGARPAIQHDQNGNPTGYVPPANQVPGAVADPGAPVRALGNVNPPTPPSSTGGIRPTNDFGSETSPSSVGLPANPGGVSNASGFTPNTLPMQTTGAGGGGSQGNPGGFGTNVSNVLGEDDDYLLRFALQSAGFNPDVITPAEKVAAKYLAPMVQARRSAYGLMDPNGGNKGGLAQDIASFASEYSKPGANFYGNAAQYAQQILGGAGFNNGIGGIADQEQRMAMYQALVPLLYGGANPLIQQSASDQTRKLFNMYKDSDINSPGGGGIFEDFVKKQQNLNPILRSIFNVR